ncbi:MAG: amino acid racemase [Vicinamibacterales bacterium]
MVIGMVGGIGPESTVDYYKRLHEKLVARAAPGDLPGIVINSIDVRLALAWAGRGEWDAMAGYVIDAVRTLERAGADFGFLSANTPHIVFDQVATAVSIPLVSIVHAARDAAAAQGLQRLALLGTKFTMEGGFFERDFAPAGLTIVRPSDEDRAFVHEKYVGELLAGRFLPETRVRMVDLIDRMADQDGIDGVILGGTELPLLLRDATGDRPAAARHHGPARRRDRRAGIPGLTSSAPCLSHAPNARAGEGGCAGGGSRARARENRGSVRLAARLPRVAAVRKGRTRRGPPAVAVARCRRNLRAGEAVCGRRSRSTRKTGLRPLGGQTASRRSARGGRAAGCRRAPPPRFSTCRPRARPSHRRPHTRPHRRAGCRRGTC